MKWGKNKILNYIHAIISTLLKNTQKTVKNHIYKKCSKLLEWMIIEDFQFSFLHISVNYFILV